MPLPTPRSPRTRSSRATACRTSPATVVRCRQYTTTAACSAVIACAWEPVRATWVSVRAMRQTTSTCRPTPWPMPSPATKPSWTSTRCACS
ncbi:hypothetical protein WR25_10352 [Diploscapter pachys]|uniref:Uncharacterized protein n=1 Tax=Diploscapter pachys TaxID=2018661 RepID=A0A2A2M708_9BILA|nr:hypothetical protein WR25_10352 [Diploscapter pachys]